MENQKYNHKKIEEKWQKIWEEKQNKSPLDEDKSNKHYHLVEFPYPSGEGLHVGHCMGYGASDTYCRMKRLQGNNVFFPIGWDAFGLPTENFAIKNKVKPQDATRKNISHFKEQMKKLGYSFDWNSEINTTDPEYYRWTQWIFIQMFKKGLAYKKEMLINWCPSCKIGLANEEVINNSCERCGTKTTKKEISQWMLKITEYADRLYNDLDSVDYQEAIKTQQKNWIGPKKGVELEFKIKHNNKILEEKISVFTTRIDTIFGVTYLVLAPENELISKLKDKITNISEINNYIEISQNKKDIERSSDEKEKTGIIIEGVSAINQINDRELPIFVADYVLGDYGTGAVMAVPGHDFRDFEFAKKYNLPIKMVIEFSGQNEKIEYKDIIIHQEKGKLINSANYNGLLSNEAIKLIIKDLGAKEVTKYKLRDWIFSRQHYWGEPIPIIICDKCGFVPVPENDLPVKLPEVDHYEPTDTGESPLSKISDFVNTTCPKCKSPAKRETDTMPNWAGSSWYYLAYLMKNEIYNVKNDIFNNSSAILNHWIPVDIYNGGMEHTTLHLLYSRFWHKFLFDIKAVSTKEPYQKRIAHGIILGVDNQKMSKSKGNVINPDEIIEKYGADTLRAYTMFIGPYNQTASWNPSGIIGVYKFIQNFYQNQTKVSDSNDSEDLLIKINDTISSVTKDIENFNFNTVISKLMEFNNLLKVTDSISKESYRKLLIITYPILPHLASELWEALGFDGDISDQGWPKADNEILSTQNINIAVSINGKTKTIISAKKDISQQEIEEISQKDPKISELLKNKKILKTIYIAGRIINFVVE